MARVPTLPRATMARHSRATHDHGLGAVVVPELPHHFADCAAAARCSIGRSTAREIEYRAGAERTFFGREPGYERRHLLRFSQPTQRDLRKHVVDMGLRHLREHWRSYGGRRDAIHPN